MSYEWMGIIGAVLGSGIATSIFNFLLKKQRMELEHDIMQAKIATDAMQLAINTQNKQIEKMDTRVTACGEQHLQCERRAGVLEGRVEELSRVMYKVLPGQIQPPFPPPSGGHVLVEDDLPQPIKPPSGIGML